MADSATLTIRLSSRTKDQLATLSSRTRHTCSFLAAEAIAADVERELATVDGIEAGIADMRAGRVTPHNAVMQEARAIIGAARAG